MAIDPHIRPDGVWDDNWYQQNKGAGSSVEDAFNKYSDLVIQQAHGDYDYVAKWLEANYKQALGSDDKQAQQFIKSVANSLEEKVGRIVYDYQTNTYRHEQDVNLVKDRTVQNKDLALKRLAEDEQVLREQTTQQANIDREQQGATLNSRGILSSTRENATGLAGKEVGMLEKDIQNRMSALERAGMRGREDINIGANQSLQDIGLADQRGREDLITGARRDAQDVTSGKAQSLEEGQRKLARLKEAEEASRRQKIYNWQIAEDLERQKFLVR